MLDMPRKRKRIIPGMKNESNGEPARTETFILSGFPEGSYISIKPLIPAVMPVKNNINIEITLSIFTIFILLENKGLNKFLL